MSSEDNAQSKRIELSSMTPEEILALAAGNGRDVSDEELEQISGGVWTDPSKVKQCPFCKSTDYRLVHLGEITFYKCDGCGQEWL